MLNKTEKISEIYEKVANKELTYWCMFLYKKEWGNDVLIFNCQYQDTGNTTTVQHLWKIDGESTIEDFDINEAKIIGHPVLIGDVLDWIKKEEIRILKEEYNPEYDYWCREKLKILELWKQERFSIEDQSEEAISYLYKLIK